MIDLFINSFNRTQPRQIVEIAGPGDMFRDTSYLKQKKICDLELFKDKYTKSNQNEWSAHIK